MSAQTLLQVLCHRIFSCHRDGTKGGIKCDHGLGGHTLSIKHSKTTSARGACIRESQKPLQVRSLKISRDVGMVKGFIDMPP